MDRQSSSIAVALDHLTLPDTNAFERVGTVLDKAELGIERGMTVLVKPNLLLADSLACSDPLVVAAACAWLKDLGATVYVADSPGFGTAKGVAQAIGLSQELAKIGLTLSSLGRTVWMRANVQDRCVRIPIAERALTCDRILSVPRIKVHR